MLYYFKITKEVSHVKKKTHHDKTNVMRLLDQAHVAYESNFYTVDDGALDGLSVAKKIGQDPATVYKTLVCQGHSGNFCVFVIPVGTELALKQGAKAAGEKSIAMIPKILLSTPRVTSTVVAPPSG